jgi:K+-transporting ATPase ATPase C chain
MIDSNQTPQPSSKTPDKSAGSFLGHLWSSIAMTVTLGIICCGVYPLIVWGIAQVIFPTQANGSLVKKDGTYTTRDEEAVGSSLLGQNFSLPGYFHPRPSSAGNGYDPTSSGGSNLGPLSDKLIDGATQSAATQPTTAAVAAPAVAAIGPAAATSVAATTPGSTQPAETLAFDGVRLRTIHYAVDNNITFKLHHAVYVKKDDGTYTLNVTDEVPLKTFEDSSGSLIDTALVDAFPHPTMSEDYTRTVVIADDFATPIPADAVTGSGSGLDPHITPVNAALQAQRVADARQIGVDKVKDLITQHTDGPSLGIFGDPGVNVLLLNLALDNAYPIPAAEAAASAPATQPGK